MSPVIAELLVARASFNNESGADVDQRRRGAARGPGSQWSLMVANRSPVGNSQQGSDGQSDYRSNHEHYASREQLPGLGEERPNTVLGFGSSTAPSNSPTTIVPPNMMASVCHPHIKSAMMPMGTIRRRQLSREFGSEERIVLALSCSWHYPIP